MWPTVPPRRWAQKVVQSFTQTSNCLVSMSHKQRQACKAGRLPNDELTWLPLLSVPLSKWMQRELPPCTWIDQVASSSLAVGRGKSRALRNRRLSMVERWAQDQSGTRALGVALLLLYVADVCV